MSLQGNLRAMELSREQYWRAYADSSQIKLRWRATTVRHCFHVLPGETVLELGAGSGLWTRHLAKVFRGRNPITAVVFNDELFEHRDWNHIDSVERVLPDDLAELPEASFDYIVGTAILCHDRYAENLKAILRLLKPGGQILFFENNLLNPQVFLKTKIPSIGRRFGNAVCQIGINKFDFLRTASHQGFINVDVTPYDIIHPSFSARQIRWLQEVAFIVEQAPVLRDLCGTLYLWAQKPGGSSTRPAVDLTEYRQFEKAVSFVIPCFNEEMNIAPVADALRRHYNRYIHEILIVNDNSRDRTAEVTLALAAQDPRIRLVNRVPPNGVGRALRDGYAAATGAYIMTMDCDFVQTVPEMRDLFEAVANGNDGAIGSRFTHESIMVNYPFFKTLCNRGFHAIARIMLPCRFGDISNNLKLFRSEVLKTIDIRQDHFAANAETGLKPIMAGYRVAEVPVSWINRTFEMGSSSFRILKVGPNYLLALWDVIRSARAMGRDKRKGVLVRKAHL